MNQSMLRFGLVSMAFVMVFGLFGCPTTPSGTEGEVEGETTEGEATEGEATEGEATEGEVVGKTYVGSDTCKTCHQAQYDRFILSGHPYKLSKVENAEAPVFPYPFWGTGPGTDVEVEEVEGWFVNVPMPPLDFDGSQIGWDEVSYIIGGYGWKARFIDTEGYIMTQTNDVDVDGRTRDTQWNPPAAYNDSRWVPYSHPSSDQVGNARKPYNCGKCHTTGWVPATDENGDVLPFEGNEARFQDELPGMHGAWSEPGVFCEACHGPGSEHADGPATDNIDVDLTAAMCGNCHTRDAENHIDASGGFIKHHEQYDEMLHSPHGESRGDLGCVTCHDSHESTRHTPELGVIKDCTDCHDAATYDVALNDDHSTAEVSCIDCHMSGAAKSGMKYNAYKGDVKTHIFAINPAAVDAATGMFNADTGHVMEDANGQVAVTLDFACMGCHVEVDGPMDLTELSTAATGIHN
jgi:hypothetical protein